MKKIIVNSSGIGIMEDGVFVKFEDQIAITKAMVIPGTKWDYDRSLCHSEITKGLVIENVNDYYSEKCPIIHFSQRMAYNGYGLNYFDGVTFMLSVGEYDLPIGYEVVIEKSCRRFKDEGIKCDDCYFKGSALKECEKVAILKKVLEKLVKVKFLSKEESERRHHESIRKEFEEDVMYSADGCESEPMRLESEKGAGDDYPVTDYANKRQQLTDLLNSETKESMSEWLEMDKLRMFKDKLKQEIEAEICSILNNQELITTSSIYCDRMIEVNPTEESKIRTSAALYIKFSDSKLSLAECEDIVNFVIEEVESDYAEKVAIAYLDFSIKMASYINTKGLSDKELFQLFKQSEDFKRL